jgi:methyl-accepting chemotaxis protein
LQRILAQVARADAMVADIAAAAEDQARGLDRINAAVNDMEQATQQNAAMAEESTVASHSLADDAGALTRLVGRFRVAGGGGGAVMLRPDSRFDSRFDPRSNPRPEVRQGPLMRPIRGGAPHAGPARRSSAPLRSIPGGLCDTPKGSPARR